MATSMIRSSKRAGLSRGSIELWARLSTWKAADGVPLGQQPIDGRIVQGQRVQVGCDPVPLRDQRGHLGHHAEGGETEQVDFHQAGVLDRVFVPLRDHDARLGRVFQRHDLHQRLCGHQHPAGMDREVPRHTDHLGRQVGEQRQVVGGWSPGHSVLRPQWGRGSVAGGWVGRHRAGCHAFQGRLAHAVQLFRWKAKRPRGVAHGQPRPIGDNVTDQRRVFTAVAFIHVGDNLVSPIVLEIQVNIRGGVGAIAEKPFEAADCAPADPPA